MSAITGYIVTSDLESAGLLPRRKFNGAFKRSLQEGMLFRQRDTLPVHFTRKAYSLYPGDYPKRKSKSYKPLVRTGTLRRRVLKKRSRQDVKGTAKGVSLRLKFGRPKGLTSKKAQRQRIRAIMEREDVSFAKAERMFFSQAGYGAKNVALFKRALPGLTARQAENESQKILGAFFAEAERVGRKKTTRI